MDPSALERSISNLDKSLGRWEVVLLVTTGLVAIGLLIECWEEIPAAVKKLREHGTWKPLLAIMGIGLITIGVIGEGVAEFEGGKDQTALRQANDELQDFFGKKAGDAETSAKEAADAAARASSLADQAAGVATGAKSIADAAGHQAQILRQRQDSLNLDIARERTDLIRLTSPRSLSHIPEMLASLRRYSGTEYTFSEMSADEESIQLLVAIDEVLQKAGWIRVPPPQAPMFAMNPFKEGVVPHFSVPLVVGWEVAISVDMEQPMPPHTWFPIADKPRYIRAAATLNRDLFWGIFPMHGVKEPDLIMPKGTSQTVRISVGAKPLR